MAWCLEDLLRRDNHCKENSFIDGDIIKLQILAIARLQEEKNKLQGKKNKLQDKKNKLQEEKNTLQEEKNTLRDRVEVLTDLVRQAGFELRAQGDFLVAFPEKELLKAIY